MVIEFGPKSFFGLEIEDFTAPDGDGVCSASSFEVRVVKLQKDFKLSGKTVMVSVS